MRTSLRTVPFWSIPSSFWKPKATKFGQNNGSSKLNEWRSYTTLNGHHCVQYGRDSIMVQIVNSLGVGERIKASNLLSDLGHNSQSLRADDFTHILEYCARSPDPLFVMEIWRFMDEKEITMNNKCHHLIIRALCRGAYVEEAFNLMSIFGETPGLYPILPTYNNLLGACAQMHSVNHANKCLDLMEHEMVGKNEVTYAELLKLAVLQQNLSAVHFVWKECSKYYSHSMICLRKFVWSFTRLGDLKAAFGALQQMVALALRGGFIITKTAEGKFSSSRLDIPIPSNYDLDLRECSTGNEISVPFVDENYSNINTRVSSTEHCTITGSGMKEVRSLGRFVLGKHRSAPVMKVMRWSFSDVIHACAKHKNYELAEQLFLQMQNLGVEPSCSTYDGLIRALVHGRSFHDVIEVLKLMQQKNLKPFDSTLATLSISCSKGFELDLAETFLDQISKSYYIYPYNAFLEACDILDRPERALRILGKMKQLKLQPDIRTYELLFSLFGNVNAPYEEGDMLSQVDVAKRINAIEQDMLRNGIEHSYLSMKNLLKALGAEGMMRELFHYLRIAEHQFSRSNSFLGAPIYNTVLHSLVVAEESHTAIDIFKTMVSCGYRPDAVTYNIMIDCCSITGCFKSACALVGTMIRDGFHPLVLTYSTLIKIVLAYDDFDEALILLNQACSEGVQPDALLFNTVLFTACEKGRIDVVELIVEWMHREKVQPDPATCGNVFSAYVDSGFYNTAMEALQVMSMRMIFEEDTSLEENQAVLEDFIHSEDLEAESRLLVDLFKESKENLAVALLNLRWCAMIGSTISWSPDQSQWAKRLSTSFSSRQSGG